MGTTEASGCGGSFDSRCSQCDFFLIVPTDGANYCLLDSESRRIVGALTSGNDLQNKQGIDDGVLPASPMLKSDREIRRVNE